jgi:hypothetical protein
VENLVQTAGHLGKTHVEEARRSARAKIHCIFYQDFNAWALQIIRERDEAKLLAALQTNRKVAVNRRRAEGKARLELMSQWIDEKHTEIDEAEANLGDEKMKTILRELSKTNKSSREDNANKLLAFERATKRGRDRSVMSKHLCDVTPWMEGGIILSLLSQKDGGREYVMAEINERGIRSPKPKKKVNQMTKKEKEKFDKKFEGMTMTELKALLRKHERTRLVEEEDRAHAKESDVKHIKPISNKLKQWLPKQWAINKR